MDAVYTVDPRTRKDVNPGVDVPYAVDQIVDTPHYPLGPHFAELARWSGQMSIVKGVQLNAVGHETAVRQMHRLKTRVKYQMPGILDIIGQYRDGQALASVTLGVMNSWDYTNGFTGLPEPVIAARADNSPGVQNIFDQLDEAAPGDIEQLAAAYRAHANAVRARVPGSEAQKTASCFDDTAELFRRLPKIRPLRVETWSRMPARQNIARNLQRTLWLLENDLTSSVYLHLGLLEWDSHFGNADRQTEWNHNIATQMDLFLHQMNTRRNEHGTLLSNTLVLMGSEIGRFPKLNSDDGKDHFPEAPYMFFGKGVRPGLSFGQTGRDMEALPVSAVTGQPVRAGGDSIELEDLGTTVLHIAGIEPSVYGYTGKRLRYLEAS